LLTLSVTRAKYYENPTMLSRVTAKNVGDVFLRHTVSIKVNVLCIKFSDILTYFYALDTFIEIRRAAA